MLVLGSAVHQFVPYISIHGVFGWLFTLPFVVLLVTSASTQPSLGGRTAPGRLGISSREGNEA